MALSLLAAAAHQAVRLMDKRGSWSITSPGLGDYHYVACSRTCVYVCALRLNRAVAQRQAIEGVRIVRVDLQRAHVRFHGGDVVERVVVVGSDVGPHILWIARAKLQGALVCLRRVLKILLGLIREGATDQRMCRHL